MPYIQRDENGQIIALLDKGSDDMEFQPPSDPEIQAFLAPDGEDPTLRALAKSDREIARVTEDLINLLVSKQVILFTELPMVVQKKLLAREKLRTELNGGDVSFMDDEDTI